jgi:hypothetical protein
MVCGGTMCQLEIRIRPKRGEVSNLFSQPRYAHLLLVPYPMPTSGRSTTIPPTTVLHSISLLCSSHPSLPFHSFTPVLHSLSHLSPLPFSSLTTYATSTPSYVGPTTSSQPPCLLHLAITHQETYRCTNHPTRPSSTFDA